MVQSKNDENGFVFGIDFLFGKNLFVALGF